MTLGDRIKARRQAVRMSQEMLAERVGVSRQAVTKWESGQSEPNSDNLYKLAAVLNTTVEQLLPPAEQTAATGRAPAPSSRPRRSRWRLAAALAGLWLGLFLLGRLVFGIRENHTVLGWLTSWQSTVYLFGWLLSTRLYWYAMAAALGAALLNKGRLALCLTGGFFLGWAAGELFGPREYYPPARVELHYGWAAWAAVFLLGLILGLLLEKRKKRRKQP